MDDDFTKSVNELHQAREDVAIAKQELEELMSQNPQITALQERITQAKRIESSSKAELRDYAFKYASTQELRVTGTTKLPYGLSVRKYDYQYDIDEAVAWCEENMPDIVEKTIDKKDFAYRMKFKHQKDNLPDFVTAIPSITIPTKLDLEMESVESKTRIGGRSVESVYNLSPLKDEQPVTNNEEDLPF